MSENVENQQNMSDFKNCTWLNEIANLIDHRISLDHFYYVESKSKMSATAEQIFNIGPR